MRILIVADLHANLPALEAVREPFDVCLCLGDLVDYGVEPAPCLSWLREHQAISVRGNHDHGVAQNVPAGGHNGFKYLTAVTRRLTRERLPATDIRFLAGLPLTRMVTFDRIRFLLVHATPRDPLDEWAPAEEAFWERRLRGVEADVVCVGHTHQPYLLKVGSTAVLNPGSVGLPRDGDPRAAYALVTDGHMELKRTEYPVEDMVRSIHDSPLPQRAKDMLAEVYRNGGMKNGASSLSPES